MATITKNFTFSAGATIIAADHNSNFDTIYNDYNGNITNANISASAAIVDTKLAQITTASKVTLGALTVASQAQGDIIYASSATVWTRLGAGTAGQALTTAGASANPAWAGMTTQGDVEYHNGTTRTRLAPGTSGQFLQTKGASANPVWALPAFYYAMATNNESQASGIADFMKLTGTAGSITETNHQDAVAAGTWNGLIVRISANTLNANCVIRLRVNGANAGPVVTITTGATGVFTDTTSTTTAANDLVCISIDTTPSGSGSITIRSIQTKFSPS